jgi:hypothetical protein
LSNMWRADFEMIAAVASLAGLWFSVFAWRRAKSAEEAANRAREAVRRSNAGEDLQGLSGKAQELLACTQNDQLEAALLRSRDLLTGIGTARHRWEAFLETEGTARIDSVAKEVARISRALSKGRAAITPEIREKLLKSSHEVPEVLPAELGRALRRAEGGGKP